MITAFTRPRTLAEAVSQLHQAGDEGRIVAGGTALILMIQHGLVDPSVLISLDQVGGPSYRGIDLAGPHLRIGGGQTLAEVASSPLVRTPLPSLATACRQVGNIRIRNRATLGGNLAEADYASDPPAVLIAHQAVCRTLSPDGERLIPVGELITGFYETSLLPAEIITEVLIPLPAPGTRSSYLKYTSRSSQDRPCVGVAVNLRIDNGAVADLGVVVGAVCHTPQYYPEVCAKAVGRPADSRTWSEVAARYAERVNPLDDARGSAWYRTRMVKVIVHRALTEAARKDRP